MLVTHVSHPVPAVSLQTVLLAKHSHVCLSNCACKDRSKLKIRAGGVAETEYLLCNCIALSSSSSPTKNKQNKTTKNFNLKIRGLILSFENGERDFLPHPSLIYLRKLVFSVLQCF
jgi:hypothetical protein